MNLERIGDIAEGIAKFVINIAEGFDTEILKTTRVIEMFKQGNEMIYDVMLAFEKEDTTLARKVFKKDDLLDKINGNAGAAVIKYIQANPTK